MRRKKTTFSEFLSDSAFCTNVFYNIVSSLTAMLVEKSRERSGPRGAQLPNLSTLMSVPLGAADYSVQSCSLRSKMFNPAPGSRGLREQAEAGGGHWEVPGRGGVGVWSGFPEFAQISYSSHFQNLLPTYPPDLCSSQKVLGKAGRWDKSWWLYFYNMSVRKFTRGFAMGLAEVSLKQHKEKTQ